MGVTNKKGSRAQFKADNKPLLKMLLDAGYCVTDICKELEISKISYATYFSFPDEFKLKHFKKISYLLNKPLSEVLNVGFNYRPNTPQWVNDSVNIDILKANK